jgi:hypothetical protein
MTVARHWWEVLKAALYSHSSMRRATLYVKASYLYSIYLHFARVEPANIAAFQGSPFWVCSVFLSLNSYQDVATSIPLEQLRTEFSSAYATMNSGTQLSPMAQLVEAHPAGYLGASLLGSLFSML